MLELSCHFISIFIFSPVLLVYRVSIIKSLVAWSEKVIIAEEIAKQSPDDQAQQPSTSSSATALTATAASPARSSLLPAPTAAEDPIADEQVRVMNPCFFFFSFFFFLMRDECN
jgi:hypothetical protein